MSEQVDPDGGILSEHEEPCFICHTPTHRVDLSYGAFFCDSKACNDTIEADLQELARRMQEIGEHGDGPAT